MDGHNRLRLCGKHGIPFWMSVFEFEDLLEAKQWALEAQRGRRNLDKWELGKIALKLKPELEARGKANMSAGGSAKKRSASCPDTAEKQEIAGEQEPDATQETNAEQETRAEQGLRDSANLAREKVNTRQRMADSVGLSADTMGRIIRIDKDAPQAVKQALDRKELSINQAYKITALARSVPEDKREEAAAEMIKETAKLRKANVETDRRGKISAMFCKAVEKAIVLEPTEENVACWVTMCRMRRDEVELALSNAIEISKTFTAVAEILRKFIAEGAGFQEPKVLEQSVENSSENCADAGAGTVSAENVTVGEADKEEEIA
ncbi:MAG: hypothetical protein J6X53_04270 [Abditibacteriota bacterium]|nr:hypothetical protein [Abditibacteriota bacterium]